MGFSIDIGRVLVPTLLCLCGCTDGRPVSDGASDAPPPDSRADRRADGRVRGDLGVDRSAADLSGGSCDPQTHRTICLGNKLVYCDEGELAVADCDAVGLPCRYSPELERLDCLPRGLCRLAKDCSDPPAQHSCDGTRSRGYAPRCADGQCLYDPSTVDCAIAGPPYCDDFRLWTPQPGRCQAGHCTAAGEKGEVCFGGCEKGACIQTSGLSWRRLATPASAVSPVVALHALGSRELLVSVLFAGLWHYGAGRWTSLQSGDHYGVWGQGSQYFTAGQAGVMKHFNGTQWSALNQVTTQTLAAISGVSTKAVWAVGLGGSIVYYDGNKAVLQPSGTTVELSGVFAFAPDAVWAVGDQDTILRYDGKRWQAMPSGLGWDHYGVWAADRQTVYVVGPHGVLRGDGQSWKVQTLPAPARIWRGVWGSAHDDVFVVGNEGWILHYDGARWRAQNSTITSNLSGVTGVGSQEVYAGGIGWTLLRGSPP